MVWWWSQTWFLVYLKRHIPKYVRIMEKLPVYEKSDAIISSWSYDMEGHAKKCVERFCELANKTTRQLHKVATPCLNGNQFKEEMGSVGELSTVCSQNGSEKPFLGSYWTTWYCLVSKQTCSCSHKMDYSLWQTVRRSSWAKSVRSSFCRTVVGKAYPEFPQEQLKNFHTLRMFAFLHGLMIWKVMRRNAWSDIVS